MCISGEAVAPPACGRPLCGLLWGPGPSRVQQQGKCRDPPESGEPHLSVPKVLPQLTGPKGLFANLSSAGRFTWPFKVCVC